MTCEIVATQKVQIRLYVCAHAIAAVKWRLQLSEKKKLRAGGLSAYKIQKDFHEVRLTNQMRVFIPSRGGGGGEGGGGWWVCVKMIRRDCCRFSGKTPDKKPPFHCSCREISIFIFPFFLFLSPKVSHPGRSKVPYAFCLPTCLPEYYLLLPRWCEGVTSIGLLSCRRLCSTTVIND